MDFENKDYERILLGMMIMDNSIVEMVSGRFSEEYFFNPVHAKIYKTICTQVLRDKASTIISLSRELSDINPIMFSELSELAVTSANWEYYTDELKKLWTARKLKIELANSINDLNPISSVDVMHNLDSKLTMLMETGNKKPHTASDLINDLLSQIEESSKNTTLYLGHHTGWDNLSEIIDGVQQGKLIIIGARPSIGKTAFSLQFASNLCKQGVPVSIFSLEMTSRSLMTRLTSLESGIPIYYIRHAYQPTPAFYSKLNCALSRIYEYKLNVYDEGVANEKELFSQIRIDAKTKGVKVFIVDHIGLVRHSNPNMKRVEQLDEITQRLLHLAQELNVTIICLSQLRRDSEGKEPSLADLRDSGAIEQNADVCMFLHRERAKGNETEIPTKVIVIKNRDGNCGTAYMTFNPKQTKFTEVAAPTDDGNNHSKKSA